DLQAEYGIRYRNVTGVQTCALPISPGILRLRVGVDHGLARTGRTRPPAAGGRLGAGRLAQPVDRDRGVASWFPRAVKADVRGLRSEERRVGKGGGGERVAWRARDGQ